MENSKLEESYLDAEVTNKMPRRKKKSSGVRKGKLRLKKPKRRKK